MSQWRGGRVNGGDGGFHESAEKQTWKGGCIPFLDAYVAGTACRRWRVSDHGGGCRIAVTVVVR